MKAPLKIAVVFILYIYCLQPTKADILNIGSCNINIQGSYNQIDEGVLADACKLNKIEILKEESKDDFTDFCIKSNLASFGRKLCSIYYDDLKSDYGFGNSRSLMIYTGRYTGETSNNIPHGKGEFVITDLHAPDIFFAGQILGEPNLRDEFYKKKKLIMKGEWVEGKFTGKGEIILPMGGNMIGSFHNSVLIDGKGIGIPRRALGLVWLFDGDWYTGPIRNGKVHGQNGEMVEYWDDDKDGTPEITIIKKGEFFESELFNGTRTVRRGQRFIERVTTYINGKFISE